MKINSVELDVSAVRRSQYPDDDLPEFLMVGRSNVGKSSFVNTLVNRKNIARTSARPGKTQTLNFYLVTDTHYFENKLGAGGEAFEKNMVTEQYFVKESHAIVSSTFDKIAEDKETEIVIIPGDLVKNGEKESHKSFINELYKLKEEGKKIYVITAGHDYNDNAYVLKGEGRAPVEGTDYNDLCEMYRDFGYGDALSFIAKVTELVSVFLNLFILLIFLNEEGIHLSVEFCVR